MATISFAIDWHALFLAGVFAFFCYLLWRIKQRFLAPSIYVSDLKSFNSSRGYRQYLSAHLPALLKYMSLALLLTAFIDPRLYIEQPGPIEPDNQNLSSEGIALYLVLDQSGSMKETISVSSAGLPKQSSKMDLLKKLTTQFIEGDPQAGLTGRPNDLIGLVGFARTARLVAPLTLDRRLVVEKLNRFDAVKDKTEDGTAIGYAIYKTTNLIASTRNFAKDLIGKGKPAYEIKSSVIVLVTDGMQDPNPADIGSRWRWIDPLEAAEFAKSNDVKLYIVNVEPALNSDKFSANRSQMRKTAEITGGKFFMLSQNSSLRDIYAEIDHLEKSSLPMQQELLNHLRKKLSLDELPNIYTRVSFYPYLIALGLACLVVWAALETAFLRRLP